MSDPKTKAEAQREIDEAEAAAERADEKCRAAVGDWEEYWSNYAHDCRTMAERLRALLPSLPDASPCPNPECRGGYVGGEDPHACGQC